MSHTPESSPQAFNNHLARFKHSENPSSRRTTRQSSNLPTPRSTPLTFKRDRSSSPTPTPTSTSRKRIKSDPDTFPLIPFKNHTPSNPSIPRSSSTTPTRRKQTGYAPPARYAHLSPIPDVLQPNLLVVFVGLNPGISTAKAGHAYSHPSNRFWHLLHISGLTPERKLSPTEDRDLPRLYGYGHTNIVSRPTPDQGGLSRAEMVAGTADLEAKFRKWRPQAVCVAGKGIWEAIFRYKHGRALGRDEFRWGWQDEEHNMGCTGGGEVDGQGRVWNGARVYVTTSPSGQAASVPWAEKVRIWTEMGDWVREKREKLEELKDEDVKEEEGTVDVNTEAKD